MKIKTLAIATALAGSFAFSANAEMMKGEFSGKLTNMYAVQEDGARMNVKDEACKGAFTHMMDKEISGKYELDTSKEMGSGELMLDGETIALNPFKAGDIYGMETTELPAKLSGEYVTKIHVFPSPEPGQSRAEVLLQQQGEQYNCVAATHGPTN